MDDFISSLSCKLITGILDPAINHEIKISLGYISLCSCISDAETASRPSVEFRILDNLSKFDRLQFTDKVSLPV